MGCKKVLKESFKEYVVENKNEAILKFFANFTEKDHSQLPELFFLTKGKLDEFFQFFLHNLSLVKKYFRSIFYSNFVMYVNKPENMYVNEPEKIDLSPFTEKWIFKKWDVKKT